MSAMVHCDGCGQKLRVPTGHDGPYIRCPECGAVCDVPREAPAWAVTAAPMPPMPASMETSDDENDDKPYAMPPDPNEKTPCPKCREKLAPDAIVCPACGYNRETGEKFERLYKPVELQWETGLPFRLRIGIFATTGVLAIMATVIAAVADGDWLTYVISLFVGIALQAYVLGTYSRANLLRSRKGRVRLTRTWRAFFIPLGTHEVRWREFESITARQSGEADFWDWGILVIMLCWGLIPGVIWWYFMIQPGQFDVALCKGHGYPALILYRGPSQTIAKQIAATIRDFTKLP